MSRKQLLIIASSTGAVLLLAILTLARPAFQKPPKEAHSAWNGEGIKATYIAAQLREVDKAHCSLILSYDLSNQTDLDYRLTDGPGVVIMSRLKADGSLSQEESIH
ncbi:MAG TPA: hypothetical protein VF740_12940, partial [Candidatus Acidoferrum sp.]